MGFYHVQTQCPSSNHVWLPVKKQRKPINLLNLTQMEKDSLPLPLLPSARLDCHSDSELFKYSLFISCPTPCPMRMFQFWWLSFIQKLHSLCSYWIKVTLTLNSHWDQEKDIHMILALYSSPQSLLFQPKIIIIYCVKNLTYIASFTLQNNPHYYYPPSTY